MKIQYKNPSSRLSILECFSSSYSDDFLKDYYLIGCQHLLPSTHLMLRSFFDNGLRPERTALIGKCYSTSPTTHALMQEEGIYVCPSSTQFDSHQSYDDQFQENMSLFLKNTIDKLKIPFGAKVIVLDDGGELISIINKNTSRFGKIIGVEQTSAGYHKLAAIHLKMPVVNVARSSTKLVMESSMVTDPQIQKITRFLNSSGLKPEKVLIIGNGALGKHVALAFRSFYEVTCYDKVAQLSEIKEANLDVSSFDLIVGATGSAILTKEQLCNLKRNVVLASISSSDREFNAPYLRRRIKKIDNCHTDLFIDGIHLLNCGFPLNFQGADEDTIPLEKIQITIALLFLAVYQGISSQNSQKGLVSLDQYNQKIALRKFYSLDNKEILQTKYRNNILRRAV